MEKMLFAKAVKYEGVKHSPNTAFMVKDEDVQDLKKAGGWVVNPVVNAEENDEAGGNAGTDDKAVKETAAQKKAREKAEKAAATAVSLAEKNDDSDEEPKGE